MTFHKHDATPNQLWLNKSQWNVLVGSISDISADVERIDKKMKDRLQINPEIVESSSSD
jgi:hypothetical protein